MNKVANLISCLKKYASVLIQAHNFPDHDALASAFGLKRLLANYDISSSIVYDGEIQRCSIQNMLKELSIDVCHISEITDDAKSAIVVIDGCPGNSNIRKLAGEIVGVVDHHDASHIGGDIAYVDIRPDYGSCSTIIYTYYEQLHRKPPRDVATALMIGISIDTAVLMRNIHKDDIKAYFNLFAIADNEMLRSMVRNFIEKADLKYFKEAIENLKMKDGLAFCYLGEGCTQNLLGIMADFFLALEEIKFVILCARSKGRIIFSVRSENPSWSAALVIQKLLAGSGFGGGHHNMAGGIINSADGFLPDAFFIRASEALELLDSASSEACLCSEGVEHAKN